VVSPKVLDRGVKTNEYDDRDQHDANVKQPPPLRCDIVVVLNFFIQTSEHKGAPIPLTRGTARGGPFRAAGISGCFRKRAPFACCKTYDAVSALSQKGKKPVPVTLRIPAKLGGYAIAETDQEILMAKSTDRVILAVAAIASLPFTEGCAKQPTIDPARLQRFAALPEASTYRASDPMAAKIELGRMLYFDARLSKSQTVSCNSCHPLSDYGVDGKPVSVGHAGQRGTRNSPTVYNAAMQFAQFWDGRAPDVEVQAAGPLLNPGEMATSKKAVVKVVKSIPGYVAAFREAYPADRNPITFEHVVDSIGKFERGLVTPSRWDRFLAGDQSVLSSAEKAGLSQFLNAGCDGCHSGVLVGGAAFQKLGAVKEYTDTRLRPIPDHPESERPHGIQGSISAERGEDRAVFPSRQSEQSGRGGGADGGIPDGQATVRRRPRCDSNVAELPHGRDRSQLCPTAGSAQGEREIVKGVIVSGQSPKLAKEDRSRDEIAPADVLPATPLLESEIADLAYTRWLERGCPQGSADEDWFAAERELQSRGSDQSRES
jgi:cytochrome c peroxidase